MKIPNTERQVYTFSLQAYLSTTPEKELLVIVRFC
jgi:hypothetical protein